MSAGDETHERIARSWTDNAEAWTHAVRAKLIPSRAAGTDAAIVEACLRHPHGPVLDVGCGEGWLVRALLAHGIEAHGLDVSAALIERAVALGGTYSVATYAQLENDPRCAAGPWGTIVCNFALLGDPLHPLLAALTARLRHGGALFVQTVHPWTARGDAAYVDAWRTERFESFSTPFPTPMPWFYRTMSSWHDQFALAGLRVMQLTEPLHPETGAPLSLLFRCVAA